MKHSTEQYYSDHYIDYIRRTEKFEYFDNLYQLISKYSNYLEENSTILDVGFGSGRDAIFFADRGFKVSALDNNLNFIHELRKKRNDIELIHSSIRDLSSPIPFDAMWICGTISHIPVNQLKITIQGIVKNLKVNGYLFISYKCSEHSFSMVDDLGRFFQVMRSEDMLDLLKGNGIEVIETEMDIADRNDEALWYWNYVIGSKKEG